MAEYVAVPAANLVKLPKKISYEEGPILTDAVATPYHALTRRGRLKPGERVAIFGCGGLGIHAIQLAWIFRASKIIGVEVSRIALDRAISRGADVTYRADHEDPVAFIKKATGHGGMDLAIERIGRQDTIAMAVASLRRGGRAVVLGLGPDKISIMPPIEFAAREVELRGSFCFTVQKIEELVQLVSKGRLDISKSVSKTIPLSEINEGLAALHHKTADPIRIVVTMSCRK